MIINISKALKLSLVLAVCAGQGVYAMDGIRSSLNHMVPQAKEGLTHAMAFAKSVRGERIVGGLGGATLGLYGVRKENSKTKAFFVLSGLGVTALSSIRLNPQQPEIPAALFGSVGGALNFLGAQNFNQCCLYGAVAAGCGFVNPVLREMITQNLRLAAGFAGAAVLGKVAHLKIRDRRAAKEAAAIKAKAEAFFNDPKNIQEAKAAAAKAAAAIEAAAREKVLRDLDFDDDTLGIHGF